MGIETSTCQTVPWFVRFVDLATNVDFAVILISSLEKKRDPKKKYDLDFQAQQVN